MKLSVTFTANPMFPKQVVRELPYRNGLEEVAEKSAEASRKIAPVGDSVPGDHYYESIHTTVEGPDVYVVADKFTAVWLENGTVNNRAFAPLRRGARTVGLQVRKRSRTDPPI